MNKKMLIAGLVLTIFIAPIAAYTAYAHEFYQASDDYGWGLKGMFCKKAHMIIANHEELGLPADKVEAVMNLMRETKKSQIKQDAEIQVLEVDLKDKLHAYPVNVEEVNKLIDQKFDLKKAEAKSFADSIAKLKTILTKEQYDKLRTLKTECKMNHQGRHWKKGHETQKSKEK